MGWTSKEPSGASWSKIAGTTTKANKYQVVNTVYMARLADRGIAFKFTQNTYQGTTSTFVPPNFMDYRITIGQDTTNHQETWGGNGPGKYVLSLTIYWTGNCDVNANIRVLVGAHDSGDPFSHSTYIDVSKKGPAYTSQYTITYNGNGANSGNTGYDTEIYATTVTIWGNWFSKSGYNFIGWNTDPYATQASISPGASYTVTYNVTLYAIWSRITYTVSFNGNGATGGSTQAQTKYWGEPITLNANGFVRTNYTFLYWATAQDGSGTKYNNRATYSSNAGATLYAIWKKNNIPVFINDGGTIIQVEKAFINDGGTIKECIVYQNLNGTIVSYQ